MRLLLRCDAGPSTGVGHAVRCAALAEVVEREGHALYWSGRLDGLDWLWAGLSRFGWFAYTPLSGLQRLTDRPGTLLPPADSAGALTALCVEHAIDVVHVDHYGLGTDLRPCLNTAGVALSSVEDFRTGRRAADVVVDPNLGADAHPRPDDGSPVLLRGPGYAPLRRAARDARAERERVPPDRTRPRVLVVMGGTDAAGLLPSVVQALAATGVPSDVDVIVPPGRAPATPDGPVRFRMLDPRPDLPAVMAGMDLVVSAAGTTVWELCCVGVPMALVRVADNQADGYRAVTAAGAAHGLGAPTDLGARSTVDGLRGLLTDPDRRAALAARARTVVDGRGAERVLAELVRVADDRRTERPWSAGAPQAPDPATVRPALAARPATEADAERLLAWRNDPQTRRWSRSPDPVTPDRHRRWLRASLARDDRVLLVVEDADGPVGTVRWDAVDGTWEVSITVAPERRGAGLSAPLLAAGEDALRGHTGHPTTARAVVHVDNTASTRLFARAGYRPDGPPDAGGFARHRKDLR